MDNKRNSSILELLNTVHMEVLHSVLAEKAEEAKDKFFATLTPQKREAYKMTFLAILEERVILLNHEDKRISDNWATHFIDFHDEMLTKLKLNHKKASNEIIEDYGFEYVVSTFVADPRNLEEIIDETANLYQEAMIKKEEQEEALKGTLEKQLKELANTLQLLTSDDDSEVKKFKLETEYGIFNIELGSNEEDVCDCENCKGSDSEEVTLEDVLKSIGLLK